MDQVEENRHKIEAAGKIIKFARECDIEMVLAGGALRDLDNDKPIKDLDFFIEDVEWFSRASAFYSTFSYPVELGKDSYDYSYIDRVYELVVQGVLVNIIVVKKPPVEYILNHFDVNFCKIYFSSKDTSITYTQEYLFDRDNKCLTLCESNLSLTERSRAMYKHIPRITSKYPDFEVCIVTKKESSVQITKRKLSSGSWAYVNF